MENGTFDNVMKWIATVIVVAVVGAAVMAMMCGCTTTKYIETVRTDTVRENHMVHDSVWVWCHDSIVTKDRSDTVLVEKWHWRDRWRERLKTDTVYIAKHDTVVVKPQADAGGTAALSWWQQTKMRVGALVIFLMGIAIVWGIYKVSRKFLP